MTAVERAEADFVLMLERYYSIGAVEFLARRICMLVESGFVTWEELTFTRDDVEMRIREAWIKRVEQQFKDLLNPAYSAFTVELITTSIRGAILDGLKWEDFTFTRDQLAERVQNAVARSN